MNHHDHESLICMIKTFLDHFYIEQSIGSLYPLSYEQPDFRHVWILIDWYYFKTTQTCQTKGTILKLNAVATVLQTKECMITMSNMSAQLGSLSHPSGVKKYLACGPIIRIMNHDWTVRICQKKSTWTLVSYALGRAKQT